MLYACNTVELKKALAEKGIDTISMLSAKTQVNRNTLGRILKGKEQPSSTVIYKIASVLSLNADGVGRIFFDNNLRNT